MHPILLQIGGLKLYTYGLFVALGFITAIWFTKRNAKFYGVPDQVVSDLFFTTLICALAGARILYVLIHLNAYRDNLLDIFKLWNGGLVFFGGFIGAVLGAIIFLRIKNVEIWKTADVLSPGLALGHCVGRFGCLFAGCCYGKSCTLPIALTFTNPDSLAPLNTPLHPTQPYMIASNFILFLMLLTIQRHKRFNGMVFLSYIILYSLFRSIIEFFRGDFRGNFLFDFLSLSQGIGLLISCIALVFMVIKLRSRHGNS